MADGRRSRKDEDPSVDESGGLSLNIFDDETSDVVPGTVLVHLEPDAAAAITESIPTSPLQAVVDGATAFGIDPVDRALSDAGVVTISRLHPPGLADPLVAGTAALDAAVALTSTYKVRFDASRDVEDVASALTKLKGVAIAEPDRYREAYVVPNDPDFGRQWGLAKINAPAAWDTTTGSAAVIVAVLDTGVDRDHPELAPLLVPGRDMVDLGPSPTAPAGFRFEGDFMTRDPDPDDEVGHGTHVSGTIAALSNNGVGVAGVTWSCRLMPVKVLTRLVRIADGQVRGTGSSADIAAGIRWAADHGAHVINMSLGSSSQTQAERDAVAYAISRGVVVVAAMGNGGPAAGTSFPAGYPDVVAVGAIDQNDALAPFSQVGSHIDVVAPGVDIWSTFWNDTYRLSSGTSMASPHVAGVAALVRSANPALTGVQIADVIRQTARALRDQPTDPVPNDRYGHGVVDAAAAVARAAPIPPLTSVGPACAPTRFAPCQPTLFPPCSRTIFFPCPRPTSFPQLCPPPTSFPQLCPPPTRLCPPPTRLCPPPTRLCPITQVCPPETRICPETRLCPPPETRLCPITQVCPPQTDFCPVTRICPDSRTCPDTRACGGPFGSAEELYDYGAFDPYGYGSYEAGWPEDPYGGQGWW
jgi:subtilisin family serine protease